MAYIKTEWVDHIIVDDEVVQEGTQISAARLNNIEEGIETVEASTATAQSTAEAVGVSHVEHLVHTTPHASATNLVKTDGSNPMTGNLELKKDAARITLNRASGGVNQYAGITFKDNDVEEGFLYWDFINNKIVHITPGGSIYDVITSVGGQTINGPLTLLGELKLSNMVRTWAYTFDQGENLSRDRLSIATNTRATVRYRISWAHRNINGLVGGGGELIFTVARGDSGPQIHDYKIVSGTIDRNIGIPYISGNNILIAFKTYNNGTSTTNVFSVMVEAVGIQSGEITQIDTATAATFPTQVGILHDGAYVLTSEGVQTIKTVTSAIETSLVLQNTVATIGGRGNEIRWKSSDTEIAAIRGVTSGDRFGGGFGFYTKESAGALKANLSILANGLLVLGNGTTHGEYVGNPEGAVTAPVGSTRYRTDGGASTTLYVKQSGTGNTGWAAK